MFAGIWEEILLEAWRDQEETENGEWYKDSVSSLLNKSKQDQR